MFDSKTNLCIAACFDNVCSNLNPVLQLIIDVY